MTDDAELIRRLQMEDDQEASRLIFQKFYKRVFNYTFKLLRNHENAEEIVNDTFSQAFRKIENLRDSSKLLGWLYTIARNLALDQRRKIGRQLANIELVPFEEHSVKKHSSIYTADISTADIAAVSAYRNFRQSEANSDRIDVLKRLIRLLPRTDQKVMEFCYFDEKSQKEIAVLTNTTSKSVEHRLGRARNLVKAIVSQLDDLLHLLPYEESMMMGRYLLDKFSQEEIAELAGISPQAVADSLARVMKRWKKIIANQARQQ